MTVTHETGKVIAEGNGSATVFSFSPMTITASTDLEVTLVDANGDETALSEGTGASAYAVTVSTYPGTGSITYPEDQVTPIASGAKLVMRNTIPIKQDVNLKNQGRYLADTLEKDIDDKQVMMMLRLQEETNRSLKFPKHETNTPQIPNVADRANKQLGFNASGDIIVTASDASVIDLTSHTLVPANTTTSRTLAAVTGDIAIWGGTAGGTADALTLTTTPVLTAYSTGQRVKFIAASNNATTTPTINIDSVGANTMVDKGGFTVPIGGIRAGDIIEILYDGTNWRLLHDMFDGVLVTKSVSQSIASQATPPIAVTWDTEEYDTRAWHDTSTNNSRITIPAGVHRVQGWGEITFDASSVSYRSVLIFKNGATFVPIAQGFYEPEASNAVPMNISLPPIPVVEGDYLELMVNQVSGGALDVEGTPEFNRCWFAVAKVF